MIIPFEQMAKDHERDVAQMAYYSAHFSLIRRCARSRNDRIMIDYSIGKCMWIHAMGSFTLKEITEADRVWEIYLCGKWHEPP